MSEENKPPMQSVYNVDQLASANAYFDVDLDGETVRIQITGRHNAAAEKIVADVDSLIDAYRTLRAKYPRVVRQDVVPVTSNEPQYVPVEGAPEQPAVKVATAGRLSVESKDGKYYFKVVEAIFAQGEKGTKYGISVYPEVLKAAGLNVAEGQPVPDIHGWRVDYVLNEKGYPWKVTRLLPPK